MKTRISLEQVSHATIADLSLLSANEITLLLAQADALSRRYQLMLLWLQGVFAHKGGAQ